MSPVLLVTGIFAGVGRPPVRERPGARIIALPLLAAAPRAVAVERSWRRVIPLLQRGFAAEVLGGRVVL